MSNAEETRVLRIGVVRDGRLVLERRIRKPQEVTVGKSRKCTVKLPGEMVPDSYRLFVVEGGKYVLRLVPGMAGKIGLGDSVVPIEEAIEGDRARKQPDCVLISLDERDRGKIRLADVEILFQVILPATDERSRAVKAWGHTWLERLRWRMFGPAEPSVGVAGPAVAEKRVLRVGLVREGQILEEKLFRTPGDVSVGKDPRCAVRLSMDDAPTSYQLFQFRKGQYYLRFTAAMVGKVSVGDNVQDLAAIRSSGRAIQKGEYFYLPLDEMDRGKLAVGSSSLLFQFVVPPRKTAVEELRAVQGGFASVVERVRVWASLVSTGKQSQAVAMGLRFACVGAILALIGGTLLPWIEEHTVQFTETAYFRGYGWWTGSLVVGGSTLSLLFGLVALFTSRKKLLAAVGVGFAVAAFAFMLLSPFAIRASIRDLITAGDFLKTTQLSTEYGFQVTLLGTILTMMGFIWALVAQPIFGAEDRVLKIEMLWRGKKILERVYPEKRDVWTGIGSRADFVIPMRGPNQRLFRVDPHGEYWLALSEAMTGELFVDNEQLPISEFAKREGARVGGISYIQVKDGDWGNVDFGPITLRFSFQRPPARVVGRKPVRAMDGVMVSAWLVSLYLVTTFYVIAQFMWDPAADMESRKGEKRIMKVEMNITQQKDEKNLSIGEGETAADAGSADGKFDDPVVDDQPIKKEVKKAVKVESDTERQKRLSDNVNKRTIVGLLPTGGGGKGAMTAVMGGDAFNVSGPGNAMAVYSEGGAGYGGYAPGGGRGIGEGLAGTPGGGVQRISQSDFKGIPKVAPGKVAGGTEKVEEGPKIRIGGGLGGQSGSGKIDRASVEGVFRRRKGAIQSCYERGLKANPSLTGKVSIRFTIGSGGTVVDISVVENTTGDGSVGACIIDKVRNWPFPTAEEGNVTFVYPFLLQSGG
jgi:hypothetical protein